MIDLIDKCYSSIHNNNSYLNKTHYYYIKRLVVRIIANIIIPIYLKLTSNNPNYRLDDSTEKENQIIVSLTTYPARISRLWIVIETILRQSYKPDKIILWLSTSQFPSKSCLPKRLLKMQKRGLKINLRPEDLRSHKKYFYTLKEYPNNRLITIDDDILYPSNTIQSLTELSERFPQSVICRYSHQILFEKGQIQPYKKWGVIYKAKQPSNNIFFGSGGGTLFPINSLHNDVLNKEIFMNLCPYADDVWLNAMCRLNNYTIVATNRKCSILPVLHSSRSRLFTLNLEQNFNDKQIENITKYCIESFKKNPFLI